jgi:hypothetical protein
VGYGREVKNNSLSYPAARGKSPFISPQIRGLTQNEKKLADVAKSIVLGNCLEGTIAVIPPFVSRDQKPRVLIFNSLVANKIQTGSNAHGTILVENLIISANDWEYAVKNAKGNSRKITLIKKVPHSNNFFIIGASRVNGYYMITYFEVIAKNEKKLKNLLLKGDFLDRFGRTPSL